VSSETIRNETNQELLKNMQIEKNVPLPQPNTWRGIIDAMEPGDSILVDTQQQVGSLRAAAARTKDCTKSKKEGKRIRFWLIRKSTKDRAHTYRDDMISWEDEDGGM